MDKDKMDKIYKQSSKSPSHFLTLAQQIHPKRHQTSSSLQFQFYPCPIYAQQSYTFNKPFYPQHNKSALPQTSYYPKYRSASLPSQSIIRTPSNNHFSYYDQLKRRDYIVGRNYESMTQLKLDNMLQRKKSYDNLGTSNYGLYGQRNHGCSNLTSTGVYNAELNRFSKYNATENKKLSKSTFASKGPLIKTKIKLYQKPDQNKRITQIHSTFQPYQSGQQKNKNQAQAHSTQQQNQRHQRQQKQRKKIREWQVPIMNCNIQVKSDDEGRYYSTVESQFPTVLNQLNTYHDMKENIFTTEAVLFRQNLNRFQNIHPLSYVATNNPVHNYVNSENIQAYKAYTDKDIQTQNRKKNKQYDTYVVRRKTIPLKVQENQLSHKPQYQHYLSSIQTHPPAKQQSTDRKNRKNVVEYQINSPKKQKSPTRPNSKSKSAPKTHAQNLGLKYYYSKYYLAEQQNRQKNQNRSKSSSIRNNQKSQTKQKTKRSPSKNNTQQKSTKKLSSPRELKTKQKISRPCHANYASTHLFTTKK